MLINLAAFSKVLKVVEELVADSSAVHIEVVPQWVSIVEQVRKLVDLGIPVRPSVKVDLSSVANSLALFA